MVVHISNTRASCHACGLTYAQQRLPEPQTIGQVWQQLTEIGLRRFRGNNYVLSAERKRFAFANWTPRYGQGTVAAKAQCECSTFIPLSSLLFWFELACSFSSSPFILVSFLAFIFSSFSLCDAPHR